MRRNALAFYCALAGTTLAPLTARADEASATRSFAVSIRSESGRPLRVAFRGLDAESSAPAVAECTAPCTLELPGAVYWVEVHGGPDGELRRKLVLEKGTNLRVTRKDAAVNTAGLALGMTGPVMIGLGLLLIGAGGPYFMCDEECREAGWETYLGASLLATGVLATPTGWIMYANSKARIKDVATTAAWPRVALVPVHGGVGLSGRFAF